MLATLSASFPILHQVHTPHVIVKETFGMLPVLDLLYDRLYTDRQYRQNLTLNALVWGMLKLTQE